MVEFRGGSGGYGGITTMNTDQRQSPYHPHRSLLKYRNYMLGKMVVKCLDCHQEWEHPLGDPWGSAPVECRTESKGEQE